MGYSHSKPRTWSLTRAEQAKLEREPLKQVDVGEAFYLIRALFDLGPTTYLPDVGMTHVSWEKVRAFSSCSDREWAWWELKTLYLMCIAYTQGLKEGQEPLALPPVDQPGWTDGKTFQF